MKRLVLALALTCALSGTVLAGNIPTDGAPSPGDIHTPPSVVATIILTIISLAT
jgi:hypothetical protein